MAEASATLSWAVRWQEVSDPVEVEKTRQEIGSVEEPVTCLVAHPQSDLFLIGTSVGKVHVWDPSLKRMTNSFPAHTADITQILFVPGSQEFITVSLDRRVYWWDANFNRLLEFTAKAPLYCAALSPHRKELLAAGEDKTLYVFDRESTTLVDSLEGQPDPIYSCAWFGDTVITGGEQGYLLNWDLSARRCLRRLKPHDQRISQLRISNDGRWYVSGSWDQRIRVWNRSHRERFALPAGPQAVTSMVLSEDDQVLLASYWDGTVRVWDMEKGTLRDQFLCAEGSLIGCTLLPGRRSIITASQHGKITAWDLDEMGVARFKNRHAGEVYGVAFTPDNTKLISAGQDSQLKIWSRAERQEVESLHAQTEALTSCTVSPAGEFWAAGASTGEVRIWRSRNGVLDGTFKAHSDTVSSICFLPTGSHFITGSWDFKLKLWSVETQLEEAVFEGHNGEIAFCDVSMDGRRLASASWDGTARVWDLTEMNPHRRRVFSLEGHGGRVLCCAFSPDGGHLLTGGADRSLRLWSLDERTRPKVLLGHGADVTACRFTPDGRLLLSADRDGNVMIWDAVQAEPLRTMRHGIAVLSMAVAPDSFQVAIADQSGSLRFLDWEYQPGLCWLAAATFLKKPPLWRWGGPPDEQYEILCPECGHVELIRRRQLGKRWSCPSCPAEWMICSNPIPPWVGNQE